MVNAVHTRWQGTTKGIIEKHCHDSQRSEKNAENKGSRLDSGGTGCYTFKFVSMNTKKNEILKFIKSFDLKD